MPDLDQYREDTSRDYNAVADQRDKANEAIRFCDVPGGQWEDWMPRNYINRPRMEFNLVSQAVKRAMGEWVNNRFRVKFRPDDNAANESDAKILNGLYRRDERKSGGFEFYDNAVSEMFKSGVGAWRLTTEFADEADMDNDDQNIVMEPVYAAYNTVIWDANAKSYDKREAKRCTILHYLTPEAFEEQYPGHAHSGVAVSTNVPIDRRGFNWFSPKSIVVAEQYRVKTTQEEVIVYIDPFGNKREVYANEFRDLVDELEAKGFEEQKRRRVKRKWIEKSIFNGSDFLEEPRRIAGRCIPVVPVYGFRSWVDTHEWFQGLVQSLMDANRLFNMDISLFAERAATTIKPVPIFSPSQVQGLENYWAEAHTAEYPYMLLRPQVGPDGTELPLQQPPFLQPATVDQNSATTLELSQSFIREETGGNPQETLNPDASGKAINAVAQRVDLMTTQLFDNIKKSMVRCGEIYRSMASEVYDSTRYMAIVGEDGTENTVQLNDFVIDDKTGKFVYINNISQGEYDVIVDTGPAYTSKRQENVAVLRDVMLAMGPEDGETRQQVLGVIIENLDVDGIGPIKKQNRRNMILQGILEPESEEEVEWFKEQQAILAQQQGPDGMEQLIQATAMKEQAEAGERQSKMLVNESTARLNNARAAEIAANVQMGQFEAGQTVIDNQFNRRLQAAELRLKQVGTRQKSAQLLLSGR